MLTITAEGKWSAGDTKDRKSDANGIDPKYYGTWTSNGFTFNFGSLVGYLDAGNGNKDYFLVGTSYSGQVDKTGTLNLLYWDSYYGDNKR